MQSSGNSSGSVASKDADYDVIVVGSGAAALLAAARSADFGGRVLVLEKESKFGGNSATSGGGVWVPNNPDIASVGVADSEDDAFAYLRTVIPADQIGDDIIWTYIRTAPRMIDYLGSIGVPYRPVAKYPDYYPDVPGWKPGGRTMDCAPVDGGLLGDHLPRLRQMPPASKAFGHINLSITEASKVQAVAAGWQRIAASAVFRYMFDIGARLRGTRDRRLCMGEALVARLFLAIRKRDIELRLGCPVSGLVYEGGRVCGVMVPGTGGEQRVLRARRGVIVAAGGFEKSETMRLEHLAAPTSPDWSAGSAGNTGDLIDAGRRIGAATGLMNEAWWAPSVRWGDRTVILFFEKSKPGLMIVDRNGERFMNESITYNSYGKCIYGDNYDKTGRVPAYVIFDARYRARYMFGGLLQSSMSPDWMNPGAFGENGMLTRAATLEELASKLGIDASGLRASADEMARFARSGVDEKFGRGSDEHDRQYGDARVAPNPCLGPIDKAPFYGARIYPGDIGTKGGLLINRDGQVLDETGVPIEGLYAAGNSSASIMGDKYPGAGCTLGPALTMAYRASARAMGANEDE